MVIGDGSLTMNERTRWYSALEIEFREKADRATDDQLRKTYNRLAASYRQLREYEERRIADRKD